MPSSIVSTNLKSLQTCVLNLSAPYIPQFFTKQIQEILPYIDILIGNESEAEAWASATSLSEVKDLAAIARSIALLPKSNPSRPRIVIFTQGAHRTIVVASDKPDTPNTYPVDPLDDGQIVDTNGAGDAFAGGFLGALVAGKNLDDSILAGHALARVCVQQVSSRIIDQYTDEDHTNCDLGRLDHNTHGQRLTFSRGENSDTLNSLVIKIPTGRTSTIPLPVHIFLGEESSLESSLYRFFNVSRQALFQPQS